MNNYYYEAIYTVLFVATLVSMLMSAFEGKGLRDSSPVPLYFAFATYLSTLGS